MHTRYEKTKTPETKFFNAKIKKENSRESSISHDSGISEIESSKINANIRSGRKRRYLDSDLDTEIKIKTENHKKIKIEKCNESSNQTKTSKLVVNPFAINNKQVIPSSLNNRILFESKRRNSGPPEIKLDIKRFKKENISQEDNIKIQKKPASKKQQNRKEQPKTKCTIFNVSSKTFQIKKCSVQIERCEGVETAKKNRSPKLIRGDRRINKNEYHIIPAQFLSLQPKVTLFPCQSYTWRSIRDDDWTFLDTKFPNSKLFSGTFHENITFKGQIKSQNIRDGDTFVLITYFPKDVIEDEWMTINQFQNMNFTKKLPLNELKTEAKSKLFENLIIENKPLSPRKKTTRKYIR